MIDVEELADARGLLEELDALRERRDELAEALAESLRGTGDEMDEIAAEIDAELANDESGAVAESIRQVIIVLESLDFESLEELAALSAIRFPADSAISSSESSSDDVEARPTPCLERSAVPTWDAAVWEKDREGDDITETVTEHVSACAKHIRYVLGYFADECWPYMVDMAEHGWYDENLLLDGRDAIIEELTSAFRLWRRWLDALYDVSPVAENILG